MLFYATLPATRSHPLRVVQFFPPTISDASPCDGLLVIRRERELTRYAVSEGLVAPGFGSGRCFCLVREDGSAYWAFLAADRARSTCDCPGFTYATSKRADCRHGTRTVTLGCIHLDALAAVVDAGRLPDPRANPDADVGATEVAEVPDPADLSGGF